MDSEGSGGNRSVEDEQDWVEGKGRVDRF